MTGVQTCALPISLMLCSIAMAASKPEIAFGYEDIAWELDDPYIHSGKLILNGVDSLLETIAVYKNIIQLKTRDNRIESQKEAIPF